MAEFTRKRARQYTRRRLNTIERSLAECGYYWGDLDQVVLEEIDCMLRDIEGIHQMMDESVQEEEDLS